jgi:hypothetical protein
VAATIISYEEQVRGWLNYIAKAKTIDGQIRNTLRDRKIESCPPLSFLQKELVGGRT